MLCTDKSEMSGQNLTMSFNPWLEDLSNIYLFEEFETVLASPTFLFQFSQIPYKLAPIQLATNLFVSSDSKHLLAETSILAWS